MADRGLAAKLEADFRQYYDIDLRDLFKKGSGVTARLVLDLMDNLPYESRFVKEASNDGFDVKEHLLTTIIDSLNQVAFQSSISAAAQAGKDYKNIVKKAPKPLDRPTVKPKEKEKPRFVTGKQLQGMFGQEVSKQALREVTGDN